MEKKSLFSCSRSRFGFGDSGKPLQETALLVEEVVHQQMVAMVCDSKGSLSAMFALVFCCLFFPFFFYFSTKLFFD